MIAPHGGTLIDRVLSPEAEAELKSKASELPSITLNNREISDLKMIGIGAFSPLDGFMGQAQYEGAVNDAHLPGGIPWTIPVTLTTDSTTADSLSIGAEVALKDADGAVVGSLILDDKFG